MIYLVPIKNHIFIVHGIKTEFEAKVGSIFCCPFFMITLSNNINSQKTFYTKTFQAFSTNFSKKLPFLTPDW